MGTQADAAQGRAGRCKGAEGTCLKLAPLNPARLWLRRQPWCRARRWLWVQDGEMRAVGCAEALDTQLPLPRQCRGAQPGRCLPQSGGWMVLLGTEGLGWSKGTEDAPPKLPLVPCGL